MLPPEQFHIKRRREEEPVETLYIQSELHQKKRRFTDFIFQRVKVDSGTAAHGSPKSDVASVPSSSASVAAAAALKDRLRSSRSVSTLGFRGQAAAASARPAGISGIPTVRATSPGAEFRDERLRAEARRQEVEAKRKRLLEPISQFAPKAGEAGAAAETSPDHHAHTAHGTPASSISEKEEGDVSGFTRPLSATPSAFPTSLRRFHIARPSPSMDSLKGAAGSGVSKKVSTPSRARAILVEKLTRAPSLRGASALQTLEKTADGRVALDTVAQSQAMASAVQPHLQQENNVSSQRKRPVVNQAERKWREQQKTSISAAKEHLATKFEPESQDLDKLAEELEQVMLDIESEEGQPQPSSTTDASISAAPPPPPPPALQQTSKPPLKFQPRHAGRAKRAETTAHDASAPSEQQYDSDKVMHETDTSDGDYVYDTYIRIPLHAAGATPQMPQSGIMSTGYTDPLADANAANGIIAGGLHDAAAGGHNIDPTRTDIGIVVITSDDEEIWDQYLEEDQDSDVDWDGDDVDSNAEDNPANDYPDEELSSADEYDDNPSIYRRYRAAASDDEEFDVNDFDDADADADYKKYMYDYVGDDDDDDE